MKIADIVPETAVPAAEADPPKRLSEVLVAAANHPGDRVSVGDLVLRLSDFGLAPLILLIGVLNVVTIIPGSSTVLGAPLVFLGVALIFGQRTLWLPRRLRQKTLDSAALRRTVSRALPYLERIERAVRPRCWPGGNAVLDRGYGILVLFFALLITLPVPFGNTMPAITIILLSMGFTAKDGLWVVAGLLCGAMAIGVVIGIAGAIGLAGASIFG
jgi:hypothetical protein